MRILNLIHAFLKRRPSRSTADKWNHDSVLPPMFNPDLPTERCVVDNRVFLLGLDKFYRDAVKQHERGELLNCARQVAQALALKPADTPIEGYYSEDEDLKQYFRLMRALQNVDKNRMPEVAAMTEFQRLYDVTSAPLYGRPQPKNKLLPVGRDPLSEALCETWPEWTVARLTDAAEAVTREWDDISLVGLAARTRDAVVLTALRESVVLYAEMVIGCLPPRREFVWQVEADLVRQGMRFIDAFKTLFGDELPAPASEHAELYWFAYQANEIIGRCVRLGTDESKTHHYHWAICLAADGALIVQEFWHNDIWTTRRYRERLPSTRRCPNL